MWTLVMCDGMSNTEFPDPLCDHNAAGVSGVAVVR